MTHGYGQMDIRPGEPVEPTGMVGKGVGEQEERNKIEFSHHIGSLIDKPVYCAFSDARLAASGPPIML